MKYKTTGVCAKSIDIDIEDGIIKNVSFDGGCNGNLQGLSKLVVGMKAEDVISRIEGIHCGKKSTSCPDQLSRAIKEALK